VSPHSYRGYDYHIGFAEDFFVDRLLDSITNADVQEYLNLRAKGLSVNTISKAKICLNAVFDFAVQNDWIIKNPMRDVKIPKTAKRPRERRHYTKEQARRVLNIAMQNGIDGLTAFIPLKTGTRPGETICIKPVRDIDFVNRTLHIQETVKVADTENKTGRPKTQTSDREIPVDDEFLNHIASFGFTGYIFDNGNGEPKNYANWRSRNFKRMLDALPEDIPKLHPHELRHTFGTLLYESGTDLYTIMKIMGHNDIKVTQVYVHHSTELMRDKIKLDF